MGSINHSVEYKLKNNDKCMDKISLYKYVSKIYSESSKNKLLSNEAIKTINNNQFDKLIDNDELCLGLINATLKLDSIPTNLNTDRASHILITWLMGIGLGKQLEIFDDNTIGFDSFSLSELWLQTAMIHDYGYFRSETKKQGLTINELTKKYNLLTDNYSEAMLSCLNGLSQNDTYKKYFTYTYDEIRGYYKYSQNRNLNNNSDEKNDHGIVGGCVAFRKYCEKNKINEKNSNFTIKIDYSNNYKLQKIACFTAASHNIFKSTKKETDSAYNELGLERMIQTAPILVDQSNPILLLLSLVDTIECTKRFSKKKNKNKYLQQKTTLEKVDLCFTNNALIVDFSRLNEHIKRKKNNEGMEKTLEKHVKRIAELKKWTCFNTIYSRNNPFEVIITLKKENNKKKVCK